MIIDVQINARFSLQFVLHQPQQCISFSHFISAQFFCDISVIYICDISIYICSGLCIATHLLSLLALSRQHWHLSNFIIWAQKSIDCPIIEIMHFCSIGAIQNLYKSPVCTYFQDLTLLAVESQYCIMHSYLLICWNFICSFAGWDGLRWYVCCFVFSLLFYQRVQQTRFVFCCCLWQWLFNSFQMFKFICAYETPFRREWYLVHWTLGKICMYIKPKKSCVFQVTWPWRFLFFNCRP